MIGRRCKAGDSLSRAALIARALTRRIPAGAAACAWRVQLRSKRDTVRRARCAAPRARGDHPLERGRHSHRLKTSAAHRSAAMAGGARPDPFRTRKLSRRAPIVLRGQPVGEQGAADRWTALDPFRAGRGGAAGDHLRGAPFPFSPYRSAEGPVGPFFHAAGGCDCGPDGAIHIGSGGRTGHRGASCGHGEGPAIQLSGAGPAFMSPFLSE